MSVEILSGDCVQSMKSMGAKSVDTVITSPPYYGLRDYGEDEQIGLEQTPEEYIQKMVNVFREIRRILKDEGTVWLNIGDTYAGGGRGGDPKHSKGDNSQEATMPSIKKHDIFKPKDLMMIPFRLAIALQEDGWWVRQDIIWVKPNPMPEPVKDRCVKSHEYIFLLSKSKKYYFDHEAIKEPVADASRKNYQNGSRSNGVNQDRNDNDMSERMKGVVFKTRNKRSVWTVNTKPYKGAHFAVFPTELIEPCVLAGCPIGGTVFDPFGGSGTTAIAAIKHGRNAIICELNEDYIKLAQNRIDNFKLEEGIETKGVQWL